MEGTSEQPDNDEKSVYKILESWEENSVAWNDQPKFSSVALDKNSNTSIAIWEDYNVTSGIKEIVEGEIDNYGFILKFPWEDDFTGARIRSSEAAEQSERPRLTVIYNLDTDIGYTIPAQNNQILIKKTAKSFFLSIPLPGTHTVTMSDVKGRVVTSFMTTQNKRWYQIPPPLSPGVNILSIRIPEKMVVKKVLSVK